VPKGGISAEVLCPVYTQAGNSVLELRDEKVETEIDGYRIMARKTGKNVSSGPRRPHSENRA
jgi:hypothetical protein